MDDHPPIVILGFGRSGTTWLSDILSKCLGEIILFEPFHPCVFSGAEEYCYRLLSHREDDMLKDHIADITRKHIKNRWLLRNHLNSPLDGIPQSFVNEIWDNCSVAGFKSIRLIHAVAWFCKTLKSKPVYIIRHPLAVISSIARRSNFWKDLGWTIHYTHFLKRTIYSSDFHHPHVASFRNIAENVVKKNGQKIALMWSLSVMLTLSQLEQEGIMPFYYEDFYLEPFISTRALLDYLNLGEMGIHPSYLFTPSMVSLKTIHDLRKEESLLKTDFPKWFWKDQLNAVEEKEISSIIVQIADLDRPFAQMLVSRRYLD